MDLATVLSIVQTILTAIQTLDQIKSTFSLYQYKDELERLGKTVSIVQSVLVDADAKQGALSRQQTIYIQELKDAIYDADDVLDEFITLVKQREVEVISESPTNLSDKVRSFLSRFSLRIHNLSRKVMKVNKKLDDIASTSSKFLFKVDNQPKRYIKPESSSFVSENDIIIGRGEELEKVVRMLLSSDHVDQPNNLTSLVIVGMGGLGKTAFAQLVYNDPRVSSAFELKSWTCIADQDQWNLTDLLAKIVKGLPISNTRDANTLEQIQIEIREQLGGKKYLLVLDDVWTERYHRWQDLRNFLEVGASGSLILVTTRSKKTAQIVGDVRVHELQGLREEESWRLFERMAFLSKQLENPDDELVKLGKQIVKKCTNVPLAIRLVASLLRGEPKLKWISFRDKELSNISESDDTMNNILRLSYNQLDFSLKSCFSYCAIFPKDFVIDKQMLIVLWMAQGYISTEYVGEEYFLILLQRCFFQDLEMNEWGEIKQFKIHDLLHDLAERVAGKDICRLSPDAFNVGNKVRHIFLSYDFCLQEAFTKTHIRTYIKNCKKSKYGSFDDDVGYILRGRSLSNWASLRTLDLRYLSAISLPESIGQLSHLRCLNLSHCSKLMVLPDSITKLVNLQTLDLSDCANLLQLPNNVSKLLDLSTLNLSHCSKLMVLPDSITKLVNLQTLDLSDCTNLLQLPNNVSKLLDLRTLNLTNCRKLRRLPSGIGSLTHLHTLGLFVLGLESFVGNKRYFDGLDVLQDMSHLKGFLEVRIFVYNIANYVKEDHGEGAYLSNKKGLKKIHINFTRFDLNSYFTEDNISFKDMECAQVLLEEMQPHHDLKELKLEGYMGEIMPKWPRREDKLELFHLPNLVTVNISNCLLLRCLSSLGDLPHLKDLTLWNLPKVEYVVDAKPEAFGLGEGSSLFPSLEKLYLRYLPKLKGWWPRLSSGLKKKHLVVSTPVPCFAQLQKLDIDDCPVLEYFPVCSSLKYVKINSSPHDRVWVGIRLFFDVLQEFVKSVSQSRIISIGDFESNIENNDIDTKSTTALHRLMSKRGYSSMGARFNN